MNWSYIYRSNTITTCYI